MDIVYICKYLSIKRAHDIAAILTGIMTIVQSMGSQDLESHIIDIVVDLESF